MYQNEKSIEILRQSSKKKLTSVSTRITKSIILTAGVLCVLSFLLCVLIYKHEEEESLLHLSLSYLLVLVPVTIVIIVLVNRHMKRKIVDPITEIIRAAQDYIEDKSDGVLDDHHFSQMKIETGDELEHLAVVLKDMEESIFSYVDHIMNVTREKERIGTELALATRIQYDMLPNVFPPFPDRTDIDIFASMNPAKEVGGDFYDFFLIDREHMGLVMADVSGKGIPAALFMMMAKFMINSRSLMGGSPKEVLESVNKSICENNQEEMFVTVWLGILNLSNGKVIASNAGHEYPILRKAGEPFALLKDHHGFVVGGMEGMRYREYEFVMEEGDTLFLYTDGLAEATDTRDELFGTERILEALNEQPDAGAMQLIQHMNRAVETFVGEAPQFDDLTMMAVRLCGKDYEGAEF